MTLEVVLKFLVAETHFAGTDNDAADLKKREKLKECLSGHSEFTLFGSLL